MKAFAKHILSPLRPRLKPGIVVVGAQKAGTSALFTMLVKHPSILPPIKKELHFFDNDKAYLSGPDHYTRMLPQRPIRGKGWTTLDATPTYLYNPEAPARLHQALPKTLIVAILRDPVSRAYSDWNMFRQFHGDHKHAALADTRTFEEAIRHELAAPADHASYLSRGYYAEQLRRYFDLFPREKILIFSYPKFKRDPASVVGAICSAAGLAPMEWGNSLKSIKANVKPYSDPLPEALRDEITGHFKPHQEALWELLGTNLDLREE